MTLLAGGWLLQWPVEEDWLVTSAELCRLGDELLDGDRLLDDTETGVLLRLRLRRSEPTMALEHSWANTA